MIMNNLKVINLTILFFLLTIKMQMTFLFYHVQHHFLVQLAKNMQNIREEKKKGSPAAGDSLHLYFTNLSDGRESLLLLRCNFSLQRVQRGIKKAH